MDKGKVIQFFAEAGVPLKQKTIITLNRIVLKFMRIKNWLQIIKRYAVG
jgi:hypothetical protein